MVQNLIANQKNTDLYLVNDKNISYYLLVPRGNGVVNISIGLVNANDKDAVFEVCSKLDNCDNCLIIPIFNGNILDGLSGNNEQLFVSVDKYISYLINAVYKRLSSENKNIDNKIIVIDNHCYPVFLEWFVKKYQDRVKTIDYNSISNDIEKDDVHLLNTPVNDEITSTIPVVDTIGEQKATTVLDNTRQIVTSSEVSSHQAKDLGFVSYVLLGVVVAVISLVLLYWLI